MDDFGDFLWFLLGGLTTIVVGALWWVLKATVNDENQRRKRAEMEVTQQQPGESVEDS